MTSTLVGGRPARPAPAGAPRRFHHGRSQVEREAAVAAPVLLGALLALVPWAVTIGAGTFASMGADLNAVGRVTGLEGTYLCLVVVVLLARVPWLDRVVGMDRLARWHARAGRSAVILLCVHAVAITLGYAATDHRGLLGETGVVVLDYPDVLAATVGLGLLIAVGVLSARAARARVSYETWYFVHLYTYLALGLSFAHQLATGDGFAASLPMRVVWSGLYLATLGTVLVCRLGVPVRDGFRHRLVVDEVVPEGPGVVSIWIRGRRMEELAAEPGQFFLWRFLTRHGWWQAHPFSLSAQPDGRRLRITVKAVGDHTSALQAVPVGTRVLAEGPYGAFTAARRRHRKALLIAAGVGIAPLRALFESLPAEPGGLVMLFRASREADLVLRPELEDIARRRGAKLHFAIGRRPPGPWPTPEVLRKVAGPDLHAQDVFLCGPPGFMESVTVALRKAGVPRRHIHVEDFAY